MNDWTNPTRYKWLLTPLGCKNLGSELIFSCSASSVSAASFSLCLLGITVRESQSRDKIWEALFVSLNLTQDMQTLWCVTSFNRNDK